MMSFRNSAEIPNFNGKGDSDKGMDALVDVVKGEGRVKRAGDGSGDADNGATDAG